MTVVNNRDNFNHVITPILIINDFNHPVFSSAECLFQLEVKLYREKTDL